MKRPTARRLDREYDQDEDLVAYDHQTPTPTPIPPISLYDGTWRDPTYTRRCGKTIAASTFLTAPYAFGGCENQGEQSVSIMSTSRRIAALYAKRRVFSTIFFHVYPILTFTDESEPICRRKESFDESDESEDSNRGLLDEIGESDRGLLNGKLITVFDEKFDDWIHTCAAIDVNLSIGA